MINYLKDKFRLWNSGTKIWRPSNIYPSAQIGKNVSIGRFCEVGPHVTIGDGTRIGAMSFIPECVRIGCDVFIGPRVTFTNDNFPPSPRDKWEATLVLDGAKLGAGVTVKPGVVIGKNALIGAGSMVTCDIPANEIWCGNPARKLVKGGIDGLL